MHEAFGPHKPIGNVIKVLTLPNGIRVPEEMLDHPAKVMALSKLKIPRETCREMIAEAIRRRIEAPRG